MSGVVGFPTRWFLPEPLPQAIVRRWYANALQAILGITGLTIHRVVNDPRGKMMVVVLFKNWRAFQRREELRFLEDTRLYWEWIRSVTEEMA